MTWQPTITLLLAATIVTAGAPLPPNSRHENTAGEPVYVLLSLAAGDSLTNTTEHTFQILDISQLRDLADAVADPKVLAHEAAIATLTAQLSHLEAALAGLDRRRDTPRSEP